MNVRRGLCAAALVLILGAAARAEINVVNSIEWLTLDAELVVRGKVVKSEDVKGEGQVVYRDLTVAADEVLKGKLDGRTVQVRLRLVGAGADAEDGDRSRLFFLTAGKAGDDRNLAGRWVPVDPNVKSIDLDAPGKVYRADMKFAKTADDILRLVRSRAGETIPAGLDHALFRVWREIPWDAEIYRSVFAGSTCFVIVPADWNGSLEKMGLTDVTVSAADAPDGWTRAAGGTGLKFSGRYPPAPGRQSAGLEPPPASVFIVPAGWEGASALKGEQVRDGKYTPPEAEPPKGAAGARYVGQAYWHSAPWVRQHIFVTGGPDWLVEAIENRWSPGIVNAYVAGTGINSVAIYVGPGASRAFSADGWVHAHHLSGDPKRPFLHEERRMIPPRELEGIWRAAAALDAKTLARRDDKRKFGDYTTLRIGFNDGREAVIMWPVGDQPDDPSVRALVALLRKSRYGAW